MLSRVADALYWMSRYIERAENNARLLDVNLQMTLDFENSSDNNGHRDRHWQSIISSLEENKLFKTLHESSSAENVMDFVAFEPKNPNSIYSCLAAARENARTVREQMSTEMWECINSLYLFTSSRHSKKVFSSSVYEFFKRIVEGSHLFQGITDATMTHSEGWEFMQMGKNLERADNTSRMLDIKYHILLPKGEQVGGTVDTVQWMAVLKNCSALEAYRKIYVGQVVPWKVAEFLILNSAFPRSLRNCVDHVNLALHRISGAPITGFGNEAERLAGKLSAELDYSSITEIFSFGLHQYLEETQKRLIEIDKATQRTYCQTFDPTPKSVSQSQVQ